MGTRAASIAAVVLVTSCGGNAEYRCDTPGHSCGASGTCEPTTGFCSVPDSSCPSGSRYDGSLAGDLSGQCVGGNPPADAGIDAAVINDAPPDARLFCYGTAPISICFAAAPTGTQSFSGTIDTGISTMCATNVVSGGTGLCVLAAGAITIDGRLRGTGTKPLVLLATNSITISAAIDVGSHRNATPETGAGADPADCANTAGTPPAIGGGGAGGSFLGRGGAGAVSVKTNSTGGVSGTAANNVVLRGGCRGQDGEGTNKGTGGSGGGALLLIAGTITIGADITAGGEGGTGGSQNTSGGGGGGAGGMIWLDAPVVTNLLSNLVLANGGAGGEGSGNNAGDPGQDSTATTAAGGGNQGTVNGGDGGDGSAGIAAGAGAGGNPGSGANGGGGGGGGGSGLIKTRAGIDLGTRVSPAVTLQQ